MAIAAATPGHRQRANAASSGLNGPSDAAMDAFSDTRPLASGARNVKLGT